jgi:hypothetical protein
MSKVMEFLESLGEVAADVATHEITREAINDVRGGVHEAYFGTHEHAMEPGTPMNPTQREVYEQKHEQAIESPKEPERDMDM